MFSQGKTVRWLNRAIGRPTNSRRGVAAEERDGQRPGDAPEPPMGQQTDEGKDGGGLAFRGRQMECPLAEVTVSAGTVSFIPGPLAIPLSRLLDVSVSQ